MKDALSLLMRVGVFGLIFLFATTGSNGFSANIDFQAPGATYPGYVADVGAAFGNLVSSLVKDILTPLLTALLPGEKSYEAWAIPIGGQEIKYGKFIGEAINFLIVALALFLFIQKFLGFVMRARKQEAVAPPPLTKEQELLTEIRALLKARS